MEQFQTLDDIIAFAINRETEAYLFYYDLSNGMTNKRMHDMLRDFAAQEERHREKLQAFRDSGTPLLSTDIGNDMHIADYLVEVEPDRATDYQHVLVLAMQKEKKAFQLYTDLAETTSDPMFRELALSLAREEASHKLYLEIEYDDHILTDN